MWRQIAAPVSLICCGYVSLAAQTIAQPQTARQAILEMLLPKTPRQFEKHIPREAVPLLRDREFPLHALGEMSMELQRPG